MDEERQQLASREGRGPLTTIVKVRKERSKGRFASNKVTFQETPNLIDSCTHPITFGLPGLQKKLSTSVYRSIFVEGPLVAPFVRTITT